MKIGRLPNLPVAEVGQAKLVVAVPENAVNSQGPQQLYGLNYTLSIPKIYRASFVQLTDEVPTFTVMENTLGSIVWTKPSAGKFIGTLVSAFTASKTFVIVSLASQSAGFARYIKARRSFNNTVQVETDDGAVLADGLITTGAFIEILVYP